MITDTKLKELSVKWQTTEINVRREYIQHLFLSYFYSLRKSQQIFFKGGTALRIVFASPRFSEDLDFSVGSLESKTIEDLIITTQQDIEREGLKTKIVEAKKTSGGYLAKVEVLVNNQNLPILLQFSKRSLSSKSEVVTIASEFVPAYSIIILERKELINEKIKALLSRAKPRDFYDLYYLLRSNLLDQKHKNLLEEISIKLKTEKIDFDMELKQFLPKSHRLIIKDFATNLGREIDRYL